MIDDMTLHRCLIDLESRIDDAVENELFDEWKRFCDGNSPGDVFTPHRPSRQVPGIDWPSISINDALDDSTHMVLQQMSGCSESLRVAGGSLLSVRCNYGTAIMPSLWGAELFVMPREMNTLPTSRPIEGGVDSFKRLIDRGVPDVNSGLGAKVFATAEEFLEIKERYPAIGRHIHLYHPDLQGPMDICELLWGSALFLDIVDYPEVVKALLEVVTETYLSFMRRWDALVPSNPDYCIHWGMMHPGHIMLRDDSAMNFSPKMCDEFIKPYDDRLLNELGGGAIHFCGRGSHYLESFSTMKGLYAVNSSQPHLNDIEVIYRATIDKGIFLLGLGREYIDAALSKGRKLRSDNGSLVYCA